MNKDYFSDLVGAFNGNKETVLTITTKFPIATPDGDLSNIFVGIIGKVKNSYLFLYTKKNTYFCIDAENIADICLCHTPPPQAVILSDITINEQGEIAFFQKKIELLDWIAQFKEVLPLSADKLAVLHERLQHLKSKEANPLRGDETAEAFLMHCLIKDSSLLDKLLQWDKKQAGQLLGDIFANLTTSH